MLSEGTRVGDRWTVGLRKYREFESACHTVDDDVTGPPVTLWWFADPGVARAEAQARQQFQSAGSVPYLGSGLMSGDSDGGFVCLGWDGTTLEDHRPQQVLDQHQMARSVVRAVLAVLEDIPPMDSGRPLGLDLLSPSTIAFDPVHGARVAVLGQLVGVSSGHYDRMLRVTESESWAQPSWSERLGTSNVSCDLWKLGSVVVWLFTGRPAEKDWVDDPQLEQRVPVGWHGFLSRTLARPEVQFDSPDRLDEWIPDLALQAPEVNENLTGVFVTQVMPVLDGAIRGASRSVRNSSVQVRSTIESKRIAASTAFGVSFLAALWLGTGNIGVVRVGVALIIALLTTILGAAVGGIDGLAARALGLLIGVWWGARVLGVWEGRPHLVWVWLASMLTGLAAIWLLNGPADRSASRACTGSDATRDLDCLLGGFGEMAAAVTVVLAASSIAPRLPGLLWVVLAATAAGWDSWSFSRSGRRSPAARAVTSLVVAPARALLGDGQDRGRTAVRRLVIAASTAWLLAAMSFVLVPAGGVSRWADTYLRAGVWEDPTEIAFRVSWLIPLAVLAAIWLAVGRAEGGPVARRNRVGRAWVLFAAAVGGSFYWWTRSGRPPGGPVHLLLVLGFAAAGLVTAQLEAKSRNSSTPTVRAVRDASFGAAALLLAVGGLLVGAFWRLDHGAWESTSTWRGLREAVRPPGVVVALPEERALPEPAGPADPGLRSHTDVRTGGATGPGRFRD